MYSEELNYTIGRLQALADLLSDGVHLDCEDVVRVLRTSSDQLDQIADHFDGGRRSIRERWRGFEGDSRKAFWEQYIPHDSLEKVVVGMCPKRTPLFVLDAVYKICSRIYKRN